MYDCYKVLSDGQYWDSKYTDVLGHEPSAYDCLVQ